MRALGLVSPWTVAKVLLYLMHIGFKANHLNYCVFFIFYVFVILFSSFFYCALIWFFIIPIRNAHNEEIYLKHFEVEGPRPFAKIPNVGVEPLKTRHDITKLDIIFHLLSLFMH